ncbi:hypothetical protein FNB79_16320 [Formosa sediminum]|uniref:VCBS repeat-containing protein n=1 Tax=Formosa sediminum TaxID=2594004 RepID=A0A516GVB6_9FLAO|nr:hypothetical protein [Formosa sediminum]QDO95468.1 hypothetical protein FNB79_16320 [Formosa sediminum]
MNNYLSLVIFIISIQLFGQTEYVIKGFSEKYSGLLTIEKGYENDVFKKGKIRIINSQTKKELIVVNSDEFTFNLDSNGEVKTNISELPYGEQSILIYQDFNFDGKKDLAIMDGQNSCYHGPSFNIYIEGEKTLEFNAEFTRLAQEYCGMFQTNSETNTITTMTKSGCCWHQFSTFKVIDNTPKLMLQIEEDATNTPYYTTTTTTWEGNKSQQHIEKTIDFTEDGISEVFAFKLNKNQKKVIVFNINNRVLNYALLRTDETVEFAYPITFAYQNNDFTLNTSQDTLTFKNNDATYKIYNINATNSGILVKTKGKTYNLKASKHSISGGISDIKSLNLDNVINE